MDICTLFAACRCHSPAARQAGEDDGVCMQVCLQLLITKAVGASSLIKLNSPQRCLYAAAVRVFDGCSAALGRAGGSVVNSAAAPTLGARVPQHSPTPPRHIQRCTSEQMPAAGTRLVEMVLQAVSACPPWQLVPGPTRTSLGGSVTSSDSRLSPDVGTPAGSAGGAAMEGSAAAADSAPSHACKNRPGAQGIQRV